MLKKIITIAAIILGTFSNVGMAANLSDEPAGIFVRKYNAIAQELKLFELNTEIELLMEDDGYNFYSTYSTPEIFTAIIFVTRDDKNVERLIISSKAADKTGIAMINSLLALGLNEEEFKKLEAELETGAQSFSIFCAAANRNFILERTTTAESYEVEISAG